MITMRTIIIVLLLVCSGTYLNAMEQLPQQILLHQQDIVIPDAAQLQNITVSLSPDGKKIFLGVL